MIFVIDLILGSQNSMRIFLVNGNDEFLHQNVNNTLYILYDVDTGNSVI